MKNSIKPLHFFIVVTAITVLANIIGYFTLPANIATQINFEGAAAEYMSKPLYLVISLALIALLAWIGYKYEKKRSSLFFAAGLLCVSNIIAIVVNSI